jgi:outer membrane protein TolC
MRSITAAGVALAAALTATAQPIEGETRDGKRLTLSRALELAVENNSRIEGARQVAAAAAARAEATRGPTRPHFSIGVDASRSTNPPLVFGQLLSQEAFTEANFDPAFLNEPDALTNVRTWLMASQTLWSGGRQRAAIEGAEAEGDRARASADRARQVLLYEVAGAYGDAILARSRLDVALDALETAHENARIATELYEAGLVVRSDVLQARVRQSEMNQTVVVARSGIDVANAALALAIGLDELSGWSLPGLGGEPLAGPAAPDRPTEQLVEEARQTRPDLLAAESSTEAARRAAEAARAGWKPQIGLSAGYEANADTFPAADGTNWTVMLGARWDAYDGGARQASVRAAQARERAAAADEAHLHDMVALEIVRAGAERDAALARLEHAQASVGLSEENLRIVQDRYREGLTMLVELLDAEASLTRARVSEITARRDLLVARAALELALGRDLEAR